MRIGEYIRIMAEFVSGEIELPRFRQLVEDRLSGLRQSPEMTDEKRLLSGIELYLHEAEEGIREESEVYAQVQFALDTIILARLTSTDRTEYFSPTPSKLPYLLSNLASPDKKNTLTEDLSLAVSR